MPILPIVKIIAGSLTSFGAGTVVGNAIKATTPANLTRINKIVVGVGSIALSAIAGNAASKYVEEEIIQNSYDSFLTGKKRGEEIAATIQEGLPSNGGKVTPEAIPPRDNPPVV